jgi:hypothetical protein
MKPAHHEKATHKTPHATPSLPPPQCTPSITGTYVANGGAVAHVSSTYGLFFTSCTFKENSAYATNGYVNANQTAVVASVGALATCCNQNIERRHANRLYIDGKTVRGLMQ